MGTRSLLAEGLATVLIVPLAAGCGSGREAKPGSEGDTGGVITSGQHDDDAANVSDTGRDAPDVGVPQQWCAMACARLYDDCGLALPDGTARADCESACRDGEAFGGGEACVAQLETCEAAEVLACWGITLDQRLLPELHDDPQWEANVLRDGLIHYRAYFRELFGDPQIVNLLAIDLDHPHVRLELTATDVWGLPRRTIPVLAEHAGAIAAINGGWAPAGVYEEVGYGIMKFSGEVWPFVNDPSFNPVWEVGGRNAVGIDLQGQWHFAARGDPEWALGTTWDDDWPEVHDAMAGGSHILKDEKVHPLVIFETTQGAYLEDDRLRNHTFSRHPRTTIGIREESLAFPGAPTVWRRVGVLAAISGRHEGYAAGMTLHEAGELMLLLGCRDALELDGGGSTTMWMRDAPGNGVVNYPTDNGEFDQEGLRRLRLAVLVMENE